MSAAAGEGLAVSAYPGEAVRAFWRLLEATAGLLIGAITVLVSYQVFARYVLNDTPPWSEELCRYLFVWVSFLGACVALRRTTHLGVDSLVARLPVGAREVVGHAVNAVVAVFAGIMVWKGLALVPEMASQRSPSMGMSLQYVFAAIPVAGAIMLAFQLRALGQAWPSRRLRTGVALVVAGAAVVGIAGYAFTVSAPAALAAMLAVLVVLIALQTPIAFAVGISCIVYVVLRGDIPLIVVPHRVMGGMDSFLLLALPLFVLAGDLMNTGGITERLVAFARALVGHIRGGLGMTTVLRDFRLFGGGRVRGRLVADPFDDARRVQPRAGGLDRGGGIGNGGAGPAVPDDGGARKPHRSLDRRALHRRLPARRGHGGPAAGADLRSGAARKPAPRAARLDAHAHQCVRARHAAAVRAGDHPRRNPRRRRHADRGGSAGGDLRARARPGDLPRDPPARPAADPRQHRLPDRDGHAAGRYCLGAVVDLRVAGRAEADRGPAARAFLRPEARAPRHHPRLRAARRSARGRAGDDHPRAGVFPDRRALRRRSAPLRGARRGVARPRALRATVRRGLLHRLCARTHHRRGRSAGLPALPRRAARRPAARRVRAVDHARGAAPGESLSADDPSTSGNACHLLLGILRRRAAARAHRAMGRSRPDRDVDAPGGRRARSDDGRGGRDGVSRYPDRDARSGCAHHDRADLRRGRGDRRHARSPRPLDGTAIALRHQHRSVVGSPVRRVRQGADHDLPDRRAFGPGPRRVRVRLQDHPALRTAGHRCPA